VGAAPFQGLLKLTPEKPELEVIKSNLKPTSLVYAALAAFGAPLSAFGVGVEDFASLSRVNPWCS